MKHYCHLVTQKIRLITFPDYILYVWAEVYRLYLGARVPKLFLAILKSFRTFLIIIDLISSE